MNEPLDPFQMWIEMSLQMSRDVYDAYTYLVYCVVAENLVYVTSSGFKFHHETKIFVSAPPLFLIYFFFFP